MTPTEALSTLRASLPANPGNDGPAGVDSAALRVLLDADHFPRRYITALGDQATARPWPSQGVDNHQCTPSPAPDTEGAAQ